MASWLREHEEERKGRILGRYEVLEKIGEGATSVVHRARDRELGRVVAIKLLRWTADIARERFRREAQAAGAVHHPHVVQVFDAGETDGQPWLVMELVEGKPFSGSSLEILLQACRGVGAAHAQGIVHRDLKPANVLVTAAGEPKVADFGLAHLRDSPVQLTKTGVTLGTPLYMAPEQVEGRPVSPRTDVYALGAMLYEAAAGRPPHEGETAEAIYRKILHDDPAPPKVAKDLGTVILKALAKEPEARYETADALADDLERALRGEPITARPSSRLWRRIRKSPGAVAFAALMVALVALFVRGSSERRAAIEAIRDTARVSLDAALRLRRAGDVAGARKFSEPLEAAYRRAVERAPDLAEPEYLMGRMRRALVDEDEALACQERALRKEPDYGPALYERAILRSKRLGAQLQDPAISKAVLDDIERLLKAPSSLGENHLRAARGILLFHQGKPAEAEALLEAAVARDPLLEEAWMALAQAKMDRSSGVPDGEEKLKAWESVEACATAALAHDRGERSHWVNRGFARLKRGQWRAAVGGDPLADWRGSESDYAEALRISPGWGDALEGRGSAWARIAERTRGGAAAAEAEKHLAEAVARKPRMPAAWYWRGVAWAVRGEFARAVDSFDECLKLEPGNKAAAARRAEALKSRP